MATLLCNRIFLNLGLVQLFQVLEHYENPRNVGSMDKKDKNVGTGLVGAPGELRRLSHFIPWSL